MTICSPNYLHDAHIRYALRYGAEVICEKPLVLNPWNLDALREMELETGRKVWTILQLRHHPEVIALKNKVAQPGSTHVYDAELTYITPRGKWYHASWKGDESKSGGIITNIGIHLFDMLLWVFGPVQHAEIHLRTHSRAAGILQFAQAQVRWFLSIDADTLPPEAGKGPLRTLTIDGENRNFSEGFTSLHRESYEHIFGHRGWTLDDAAPSIALTSALRQEEITEAGANAHPLVHLPEKAHPFGG
jgi:UDP-N-acetyl-2-amino-2-deoxyglucuronate dehydrogenase